MRWRMITITKRIRKPMRRAVPDVIVTWTIVFMLSLIKVALEELLLWADGVRIPGETDIGGICAKPLLLHIPLIV